MTLQQLRKELMTKYQYMKCGNVQEFNMRLQWLSEGMLQNQIDGVINYSINQDEIKLYQEFKEKRNLLIDQSIA